MMSNLFLKLGKLFLIKYFRIIFLLICFIPLFLSITVVFINFQEINHKQTIVENSFGFFHKISEKRSLQKAFTEQYSKCDPLFIQKNVETLSLMNDEKVNLEKLCNNDSFKGATIIINRLNFLKNENKLVFKEEPRFKNSIVSESILKLQNPIEIDENDLKKLFSIIEKVTIAKTTPIYQTPQMAIQNIEMKRTNSSFIINNLTILKRDFLK